MPATAAKMRQPLQQRSRRTRTRLLEAAVECLIEHGYAATTTVEVGERAGLSRGAQLHHFPTRAELVTAAIIHLHERRVAEFRQAIGALPAGAERLDAAIDLLWSMFKSPTFDAVIEIFVAARTDRELRAALLPVARRFARTVKQTARDLFPEASESPLFRPSVDLVLQLMQGMAVQRVISTDSHEPRRVLDLLKLILQNLSEAERGTPKLANFRSRPTAARRKP